MDMEASSSFSRAFEYASGATGERFQNPLWRVTGLLFGQTFRVCVAEVKAYGRDIVATAMKNHLSPGLTADKDMDAVESDDVAQLQGSLINSLIDEIESPQVIADAALNFLSAGKYFSIHVRLRALLKFSVGRDTTAQALTWTFYLLSRNPDALTELRKELSLLQSEQLSYENLQTTSLPYTLAIFNESLRLFPPVPFEIKQCRKATNLPDGTFLPKGAVILWCVWAMGRSEQIWGSDDLEAFKPRRWLEPISPHDPASKMNVKVKSNFEFPVFNGGARLCLGRRMAELQAVYTIASLLMEFDFEEVLDWRVGDDGERITRNSLTLPMDGGLPCRIKERSLAT